MFPKTITISVTITWKRLLYFAMALLQISYICWTAYWFVNQGLYAVKWHTSYMLIILVWEFTFLLLYFLSLIFTKNLQGIIRYIHAFFLFVLVLEILLNLSGTTRTYTEKNHGFYYSPYQPNLELHYNHLRPNYDENSHRKEFRHIRHSNNDGFADKEWFLRKDTSEFRVLCLGDSFTEGDGAPYDSTYVSFLEKYINKNFANSVVMNAGIRGSDPFFNFVNYRDKLVQYKPNVVIQTITSNDIFDDIRVRGGMERFLPNSKVKYKKMPVEPLYACSHIARSIYGLLGYNQYLLKNTISTEEYDEINTQLISLFKEYAETTEKNKCKLVILLLPVKWETKENKYVFDFSILCQSVKNIPNVYLFDLNPYYQKGN